MADLVADSQGGDPSFYEALSQTQQQYTQTQTQSEPTSSASAEEPVWGILQPVEAASQLTRVEFQRGRPAYTIGRGERNDVVVADRKVSGVHCRIWTDTEEVVRIEDLSTNGELAPTARCATIFLPFLVYKSL
jgi:pSer/pThr/pTyr-binding forkhead associated (FHA) protein